MPVIEVDDLTFRYPKTAAPAVKGMSFSVDRGERLAVMRVIRLAVFTVPMIPFFILGSPWRPASGFLPPYWPVRAFWSAYDGGSYRPSVAGGPAYDAALVVVLLRVVTRRLR